MLLSYRLLCIFLLEFVTLSASQLSPLLSNGSDPDAFLQNCVNVINGEYCESATDLTITGPDSLILQRFYNRRNAITGPQGAGWRIFPERFLVIGKDHSMKSCTVGKDQFEWNTAFVGERSGGILPYSGWRNVTGVTKDPLKVDIFNNGQGIVNTHAGTVSGQTNYQNNALHFKVDGCELILGDGTKRIYQKSSQLPELILGEELVPSMASEVVAPEYFLLTQEILPSGNRIYFSYDSTCHLSAIEIKNSSGKQISWIHFTYHFQDNGCLVEMDTSDERTLAYQFKLENGVYHLIKVAGSHCIPISYEYKEGLLIKKLLPEQRFLEIQYEQGKVKCLKGPNAHSGKSEEAYSIIYGDNYTDLFNANGVKTRYTYDKRFQLITIDRYDEKGQPYRTDQKIWGKTKGDAGLLLAKTIGDGNGRIYSFRSFQYDKAGNVIEERLYGNLTGKQEACLSVINGQLANPENEECHVKTFEYSSDGFNLLIKFGDSKGNKTRYIYKPGTNQLIKKFIYDTGILKKRLFQTYNEDAACIRIVEDDGYEEDENKIYYWGVTERHITEIKPKEQYPGVGLPEVIDEKALDLKKKQEILMKKQIYAYDNQSNLLSCTTYDANGQYAFSETTTYNSLGLVASKIDIAGREEVYIYDEIGNLITTLFPQENKCITTEYNFQNKPVAITEKSNEDQCTIYNAYDVLGRKIASTDRFGNSTVYEYDCFDRLTKVIYPQVYDENQCIVQPYFSYIYDLFGNVITIKDSKGFATTKSYNLRGSPTKISYPDGSVELFKYDTEGSLHRSMTREKIITVYEYDYLGRCTYEEYSLITEKNITNFINKRSREYNAFRLTHEIDNALVKRYNYDFAGRVCALWQYPSGNGDKDPAARLTEIVYDACSRPQYQKVWFGFGPQDYSKECFEYDHEGNILEKRIEDAAGTILIRKGFTYDLHQHCVEEYGLENGIRTTLTKTTYNSDGEPISYTDGCRNETKIIIDNYYQNDLGQTVLKKTIVNPIGIQTEVQFDALGRVVSTTKKDAFGTLLSLQEVLYDALGNKACDTHAQISEGKIIGTQKIRFIYGSMGRLEEQIEAADSEMERHTRFYYNSLGQLNQKTLPGIATPIQYTYTIEGRVQTIAIQNNKKELQTLSNYSYDKYGNILTADCQGISVQRTYNLFSQLATETIKDGVGTYALKYTYDRKGRLKEITLPDNSKIEYGYDALFGREVKRKSSQGELLYSHTYDEYNELGSLLSETHVGYVGSSKYTYDNNNRKINRKTEFLSEEYRRDHLGRLVEVNGNIHQTYSYNGLSQLTSEARQEKTNYAYDSLDNCIQINQDELVYNALNQLKAYSQAEFSYDAHGNLLRKVLDGEETRFESNLLAQITTIELPNQTCLNFTYDALGRLLVEKQIDRKDKNKKVLSTSRYFYIGHQEIGSLTSSGAIETLKIPGLQGDKLTHKSVAFELKSQPYVPLHDIAGNVVHLLDPQSREVLESYQYSSFGKEIIYNAYGEIEQNSVIGNPWRFAEKRKDPYTGLILFGLRFYDPSIGRWITRDPAGYIDGPNLYAYLHNNPLNCFDRFGLATETNDQNFLEGYMYGEYETHCYCERHRTCKRGGDIGKTVGLNLPKVIHSTYIEKIHKDFRSEDLFIKDCYDDSSCYDLSGKGLPNLPNDLGIGFINGIWNDFKSAKANAHYLSRLAGGYNIHAVYNATHGPAVDFGGCGLGLNYIATEPVRQLHKMWNSFFDKSSASAKFLMVCHSQGAIHVRNALLDYPPALRERILVVAIAPGAYIYQETCAQVIHYRAEWWRDFMPRFDVFGAGRTKDTIFTLSSHPNAPIFDHEFMSPTYQRELRKHLNNYIKTNGKTL